MSRSRREPPVQVTFRDAAGNVVGTHTVQGARRGAPASAKATPRGERQVVVLCPREHLLAVVDKNGYLTVEGYEKPGWLLRDTEWAVLVWNGQELRASEPLPEPVPMMCAACESVVYELPAADVPPQGKAVARRAGGSVC